MRTGLVLAAAALALAACGKQHNNNNGPIFSFGKEEAKTRPPADVDGARLLKADAEPGNWMSYGRTYDEQRFSPLDKVNTGNVGQLSLAWSYDLDTHRGQEATPIVVDGVMYVSTAWSKVKALDARTGALIWAYDPKVDGAWGARACCDVVNRGVAVWKGKVYVGTLDGRLVALDAKTGNVVWAVQTTDPSKPQTITGAPRVVKGKVLIGNSGAEFNVRGYISAYDAETGRLAWRFYTVPGDPSKPDHAASDSILKKAVKTWSGRWWTWGGGGTVWDSIVYDPDLNLLIFGTDNGDPWNKKMRSPARTDDLFLTSIVAVNADTGAYVWHYQLNPGDEWDYSATQQIILADLTIDGVKRKVAMQAPKNGFFYVIDRTNGKLISAKPFATVTWASGIDQKTGRPIENPAARYSETGKPFTGSPSPHGAHSWMPMSFNPKTGLVYIPVQEVGFTYVAGKGPLKKQLMGTNMGLDFEATSMPQDPAVKAQVMESLQGHIAAWDPSAQKEVWRINLKGPWNGGALTTAGGLLFEGNATGEFAAYRLDNAQKAWSFDAQSAVMAGPVTYTVGGEQYVAVLAGWGGTYPLVPGIVSMKSGNLKNISRVLVFKLNGTAKLPPVPPAAPKVLNPPPDTADAATIKRGFKLFVHYCSNCHGDAAVSGGETPDLRYSPLLSSDSWFDVVLGGVLKDNGMVSWSKVMTREDADAVRAYVIRRAHETQQQQAAHEPWAG
jgi:alcohol dehydrogenase (cytochrome c)/quinohemoprotein ethanol dehydrogenase